MAELWNRIEKRIERGIADSEVQERIFSGKYDFLGGPDAKIFLDMGRGQPSAVPANTAARYISKGATYLTPVQLQSMRENKEFAESGLGMLSAAATGADEYLFAGGGSHALEAMQLIPEGRVEAIQAENPWINHGVGIGASILAALGSLGGSAKGQLLAHGAKHASAAALKATAAQGTKELAKEGVEKSAKSILGKGYDATKAGLASYTLPGIGTRLANAVDDKVHSYLMEQGGKYVPKVLGNAEISKRWGPHVAKMVSATIGAGVEGGVWGTGAGISEAIIGEPEESAEHLLDAIGTNMLMGMAFGGTIAGVMPFLAGARGVGANVADKFLDFSGRKTSAMSKKFAPYLVQVAEEAGHPPETVAWLKRAAEGEIDLVQELDSFMRNMDSSAAEAAKILDLLRIQEQFIQISDIQGFKLDTLIDAVEATVAGQKPHFNIGAVFDEDTALQKLKQSLRQKSAAQKSAIGKKGPGMDKERESIAKEIADLNAKIASRERQIREASRLPMADDMYKIPEDMGEVLGNTAESYVRVRQGLAMILEQQPDANANKQIENIIRAINKKEVELYEQLFSEENFKRYEAKLKAEVDVSQPTKYESRIMDELSGMVTMIKNEHYTTGGWKPLTQAKEIAEKAGTPFKVNFDLFEDALGVMQERGDLGHMFVFLDTIPEGAPRRRVMDALGINKTRKSIRTQAGKARGVSIEKLRNAFRKRDTLDLSEDRILNLGEKFSSVRKDYEKMSKVLHSMKIVIDDGHGRPRVDPFAWNGPFDFVAKDAEGKLTGIPIRQKIDALLKELDYNAYDPSLVARAFKSIEDMQTLLLKNLEYGKIPENAQVTSKIQDDIIRVLREEMKDTSRWGQMAKLKQDFDDKAKAFAKFSDQITGKLTKEVGPDTLADPKAFLSFIKDLDNHKTDIVLQQINGYGKDGRELIDFIRRNFDQVGIEKPGVSSGISEDLPESMVRAINKKLKKIDEISETLDSSVKSVSDPSLPWDDRLESMVNYSSATSQSLDSLLEGIREKLPIAEAMLSTSARNQNLSNLVSDIGRGGVVSAIAYGATGSKTLATAAGAMVGAGSMALSPERYLQFVHQLSILNKANKKMIEKYMKNWAENTVPKAAISQEWEKQSRSMLLVAGQPYQRDKRENRSEIRKKAARNRSVDAWSERIEEALNSELTEENYFEVSSVIRQLATNKFLMERFARETTKMFDQTPDIRNAMKAVLERKIKVANKMLPRSTPGTVFGDPIPPPSFRLQEFGRVLQILNSPKDTILTAMLSGTLTPDMVRVFSEAWPKLHEEVSMAALESIKEKSVREKLTQSQKMVLSALTGAQMMEPAVANRVSQTFAPKEGQGQQGAPGAPGRRTDMSDLTNTSAEGTMSAILARQLN